MAKKEKEIEKMAEVINLMDDRSAHYYDKRMRVHEAFADCDNIAKVLYDAGYRQKDELAKEFFAEIDSVLEKEKENEKNLGANTITESVKHNYAVGVYGHLQKTFYEMGVNYVKKKEVE